MANPRDIAKLVNLLKAAYPNWMYGFSAEQIDLVNEVYYQDLKNFDAELLGAAVTRCRRSKEHKDFAPSVGAIRYACIGILREIEGIPSELEAWEEVCNAPKPHPANFKVVIDGQLVDKPQYAWSHPLVEKTARMMGFPDFPKVKGGRFETEGTDRAHFFKQYNAVVDAYFERQTEHPQVIQYIADGRTLALESRIGGEIKKLADGMKK